MADLIQSAHATEHLSGGVGDLDFELLCPIRVKDYGQSRTELSYLLLQQLDTAVRGEGVDFYIELTGNIQRLCADGAGRAQNR